MSSSTRAPAKPAASSRPAPPRVRTSYVAVKVRNKLQDAAAAPEWNLSRLVAHANTLDSLAIRLSDPERKKRLEAEELERVMREKEETQTESGPSPLRRSLEAAEIPREEVEQLSFSDDTSDEDESSESEGGWLTTEPSTALEHTERTDYFASVGSETARAPDKPTSVGAAAATPETAKS